MSLPHAVPEPVDRAAHFPGFCETCTGTQGPFVDTGVDRPAGQGDLHVYICRSCARDIAKIMGYVKGERAAALDQASDRLTAAESERDEAAEAAHKMADALATEQAKTTMLERDRDRLRDELHMTIFRVQQSAAIHNEILVGSNGN